MYESAASGAAATTPTAGGYTVGPVATITAKGARNVALRDSAVAAVAAAATGSGGTAVTNDTSHLPIPHIAAPCPQRPRDLWSLAGGPDYGRDGPRSDSPRRAACCAS